MISRLGAASGGFAVLKSEGYLVDDPTAPSSHQVVLTHELLRTLGVEGHISDGAVPMAPGITDSSSSEIAAAADNSAVEALTYSTNPD